MYDYPCYDYSVIHKSHFVWMALVKSHTEEQVLSSLVLLLFIVIYCYSVLSLFYYPRDALYLDSERWGAGVEYHFQEI